MAESLAAVGVASCILQVVDFGAKVIKTSYILISASQDALREEIHLSRLVHEQDELAGRLHASLKSRPMLSANEQAVVNLSGEVKTETDSMLRILGRFKLASSGQNCFKRSIHSVKTAVKIHRTREAVEDHRKKLQLVNGQLAVALLSVLGDQNEDNSKSLQKLQRDIDSARRDVLSLVLKTRDELMKCFDKFEERRQARIWAIIRTLQFPEMQSRQQSIKKASPETYCWALENDTSGLRTWLRTGSDVYWVSGKAGSGKSTFMKFLSRERRTFDYLHEWSGYDANLIVIECYFWYLGSALQKSIEGLLRTIVCQILCKCPKVVEILLPTRWARTETDPNIVHDLWSLDELETVLKSAEHAVSLANARTNTTKNSKFCIFIDGLDEYSGNHLQLIRMLEKLATSGSTKLCVSSRPWNVFVKNFELRKPHLCLQDLTGDDMRMYVGSSLRQSLFDFAASEEVPADRSSIESIIAEIVDRAEGVFLWVYLVVQSVLRGLDECDSIAALKQRVREFPPDLEGFFDTIVSRVDTVYKHQTAQALTLAYLYAEHHDYEAQCSSYLDFALLGHNLSGLRDPEYLWNLAPRALSPDGFLALAQKTRTFLSACCKDLLVVPLPHGREVEACAADTCTVKVQFLHRTVFEFLQQPNRQLHLSGAVPECFKDGSVFHILNMAKLKYYWEFRPNALSEYFTRQASFSLDHGWTGLDVRFIDQMQKSQTLHQEPLSVSVGQAYIAFQQFDTFWSKYTSSSLLGDSHRSSLSTCHLRTMTHRKTLPDCDEEALPVHLRLLKATLGIADCMDFEAEEIDLRLLAFILTEINQSPRAVGSSSMVSDIILMFLERSLQPLVAASIEANTNIQIWTDFFQSPCVRHMYDIFQLLIHNGSDTMRQTLCGKCPVSEHISYGTVWQFLTSSRAGSGYSLAVTAKPQLSTTDHMLRSIHQEQTHTAAADSATFSSDELDLKRFASHMQVLREEANNLAASSPSKLNGQKRPPEEDTKQLQKWREDRRRSAKERLTEFECNFERRFVTEISFPCFDRRGF